AGLHHLLEVAQVLGDLLRRRFAEEPGDHLAGGARRGLVLERDPDLGAATARRWGETHRAGVAHAGVRERAPGDQLVLLLVGDFGVPLDPGARGGGGDPVRAPVTD